MRFVAGKFGRPECVGDMAGSGSGERRLAVCEVATGGGEAANGERRLSDLVDEENASRSAAPTNHPQVDRLIRTIWRLRQADGCSWDREQTHASITKNMVEEAYEAVDAIEANDAAHLCEELGDVLEQVLLHSQIAADADEFDIDDVARGLNEKLVRRHPHGSATSRGRRRAGRRVALGRLALATQLRVLADSVPLSLTFPPLLGPTPPLPPLSPTAPPRKPQRSSTSGTT